MIRQPDDPGVRPALYDSRVTRADRIYLGMLLAVVVGFMASVFDGLWSVLAGGAVCF